MKEEQNGVLHTYMQIDGDDGTTKSTMQMIRF